jgi:hypothetical protein
MSIPICHGLFSLKRLEDGFSFYSMIYTNLVILWGSFTNSWTLVAGATNIDDKQSVQDLWSSLVQPRIDYC